MKGTGAVLSDPNSPLLFPRNFNRISAPDANSCFGCHSQPRAGGGGDVVANVFVLGQRFDFATFDSSDPIAYRHRPDSAFAAIVACDPRVRPAYNSTRLDRRRYAAYDCR